MTATSKQPALAVAGGALVAALVVACTGAAPSAGPDVGPPNIAVPVIVAPAASIATGVASAYVSVPRNDSARSGATATVQNLNTGRGATIPVVSGGFDPVAIPAVVGDTLVVNIKTYFGPVSYLVTVPAMSPATVLRTDPSPDTVGVQLDASIRAVFNQPIDASTLNASTLQLLRGGAAVPGQVRFTNGDQTEAVFVPDEPLAPNTRYELVVDHRIRDSHGQPLATPLRVEFTSGTEATPNLPVATLTISPVAITTTVGLATPLNVTPYDAAGNPLNPRSVAWTSSDSNVAPVSSAGIVIGARPGTATVTATSEGVYATTAIVVSAPATNRNALAGAGRP